VSLGGVRASGQLRVSAPAGFGRQHVAPLVGEFMQANPEVTVNLDLSDRLVDLLNENIDCAIRIGELTDSSLVSVRLGEMRRMVVASPAYLVAHGVPRDAGRPGWHNCLSLGPAARLGVSRSGKRRGRYDQGQRHVRMQRWCRAARMGAGRARPGLALAVGSRAGSQGRPLTSVLDAWQAPPMGIYAVFPQRRHLPLRVRLFIDLLKDNLQPAELLGTALSAP
jgi:DNA-binding transcriptional LysR family regulator